MYSVTGIPAEKENTWTYLLESRTSSDIARVEIKLTFSTLKSHSFVGIGLMGNELAKQIQQQLEASLGDITKSITPEEFVDLMSQEWAKAYNPKGYYKPSRAISLIVRPYADQDSLPSKVIKDIADELDTTQEIALDYGMKAKTAINQGLI
jgi:hypothetical protein